MSAFNPYCDWLDIPPGPEGAAQPPNHYRLLGIELFESDDGVIREAAAKRMQQVRRRAMSDSRGRPQPVLDLLREVEACLLNSEMKIAYDSRLRVALSLSAEAPPAAESGAPTGSKPRSGGSDDQPASKPVRPSRPKKRKPAAKKSPPARRKPATDSGSSEPSKSGTSGNNRLVKLLWTAAAGVLAVTAAIAASQFIDWGTDEADVEIAGTNTQTSAGEVPDMGGSDRNDGAVSPGSGGLSVISNGVRTNAGDRSFDSAELSGDAGSNSNDAHNDRPSPAEGHSIVANDSVEPSIGSGDPQDLTGPVEAPLPAVAAESGSPASQETAEDLPAAVPATAPFILAWPKFRSETDKQAYFQALEKLLETGLETSRADVDAARELFEQAQGYSADDPRLNYAYGLVLLEKLKYNDALAEFTAAGGGTPGTPQGGRGDAFLPAWQAVAWVHILRKDLDAGLKQLQLLAEELERPASGETNRSVRTASAVWVGRTIGYLKGPASLSKRSQTLLEKTDANLRKTLHDERLKAYQDGIAAVGREHETLLAGVSETAETSQQEQAEELERKKRELEAQQGGASLKKEEIEGNVNAAKQTLDAALKDYDGQLTTLQTEYTRLATLGSNLSTNISQLKNQIASIELSAGRAGPNFAQQQQIRQYQSQIQQLQSQYNAIDAQAAVVRQKALRLLAQRKAAVDRYQRQTGQLVKQNEQITRLEKQLEQKVRKVDRKPVGNSAQVTALRRKLSALATYVPLEFEAERLRILASYPAEDE